MTAPAPETGIKPEADWLAHLAAGRFLLPRAKASGQVFWHPRVAEPRTGDTDLEWVEATGRGVVYSTSVMRMRPPKPSYNVALIDLEEGPRMMSRVDGLPPEEVRIGMKVQAKIIEEDGAPLLVFLPVGGA